MTNKNENIKLFQYFTLSSICFLAGLGTVLYVDILLPHSTETELYALIGLCLSVPSGLIAFYCYIRMLISRIKNFLDN